MSAILSLILFLLTAVSGRVVYHQSIEPIEAVDAYGEARVLLAGTECRAGVPHVWLAQGVTLRIFAHELVHAYDCFDDAVMNGSPGPERPPSWGVGARIVSRYCWENDAEWSACESVRDPVEALRRMRSDRRSAPDRLAGELGR